MTWREWVAARRLLYEEHLGWHLRAKEREQAAKEEREAEAYRRSVQRLKRQQE